MKRIITIMVILVLYGCGGGGSGGDSSPAPTGNTGTGNTTTVDNSRQDAINLAYDVNYSVPSNFRQDRTEEILHLRTASTFALNGISIPNVERCEETEELFFNRAAKRGDLINGRNLSQDSDVYWETVLQVTDDNVTYRSVYARAFKCGYFHRSDRTIAGGVNPVDVTTLDGNAGQFPDTNFDTTDTFEYLYTITDWSLLTNPIGKTKIIETRRDGDLTHTLVLVSVIENNSGCDTVNVGEWQFTVSPADRTVQSSYTLLDQFEAQVVNNTPRVCN